MRLIKFILPIIILLLNSVAYGNVPIIIIRFNEPEINIKQPIGQVVRASQAVKPNVFFDIVSVTPIGQNYLHESTNTVTMVENAIRSFGVPANKIRVSQQKSPNISFKEAHIFVR